MAASLPHGCTRSREWVSLHIDSELSELERLLLRRHLSRCDGCRAFADALAAATEVVRVTPVERPSRALEPVPLRAGRAPRARRLRYGLVAAAAAAMVAAGVSTAVLISGDDRSPGQTPPVTDIALRPPGSPGTTFVEPPRTNV